MDFKKCRKCGLEKNANEFRNKRNECKQCEKELIKEWRRKNKKHIKEYSQKYFQEHKDEIMDKRRKYMYEYRQTKKYKEHKKEYAKNNRERSNKLRKIRYNSDYIFKLKHNLRVELLRSFKTKDKIKNKHTKDILNCDIDYFIKHLLKTFENNYGYKYDGKEKVHIDHIIPLALAKNEEEILRLCHYSNLQLLKAQDNLKKSSKVEQE